MKERTCCFTGHRLINRSDFDSIKAEVKKAVIALINKGVIFFGAGGALGFDTIAAESVLELKESFPQIKLILVLPCKNQTRGWSDYDVKRYKDILRRADKVVYVSEHYYDGCMQKRNRHLVDNSGYCICYLKRNSGGTAYTVNYAIKNGLTVYNVAKKYGEPVITNSP